MDHPGPRARRPRVLGRRLRGDAHHRRQRHRRPGGGLDLAATYLLPDADWATYYAPLTARIAHLRTEHPGHDAVLDGIGAEIGVRAAHGADYGYTGYVLRPRPV